MEAARTAPALVSIGSASRQTHFERIGGTEPITRLVERFYDRMDSLPEARVIRSLHPADLTHVKLVLVAFLIEWMGGPKDYSAQRGHPRLRMRHMGFPVDAAARDAWMQCMRLAMEETIEDTGLRQQLEQAFFKTADFIRNQQESHHDHHR